MQQKIAAFSFFLTLMVKVQKKFSEGRACI